MSKNISVQEGSIGKQLTVDKLKTNLVGGGSCLWVPEDEINLGTKSVSENGTYVASDDGYYGYSQFTVSGVGTVTGRDPTTGDEKQVSVDPETGDLVETVLPSEIRVITPPTNPSGTYIAGQTITKDGMVVKAYDANGAFMQNVPVGEITINPTVAVYDPATSTDGWSDGTSEDTGETAPPQPIRYSNIVRIVRDTAIEHKEIIIRAPHVTAWRGGTNGNRIYIVYASSSTFTATVTTITQNASGRTETTETNEVRNGTTYLNKQLYFGGMNIGGYTDASMSIDTGHGGLYGDSDATKIAYIMVYGEHTDTPAGSRQAIGVSWPRPGDGKVLETSFTINVTGGST